MVAETVAVRVTARQRAVLEELVRAQQTPQALAARCRVVLLSEQGVDNMEQGRRLMMDRQRVRRWRRRWGAEESALRGLERKKASDEELRTRIIEVLSDNPRSGTPSKFTPEQVTSIIALACEVPADSGLPISHWTPTELAREAIKRGIVGAISARQVDRFLSRSTSVPTRAAIG